MIKPRSRVQAAGDRLARGVPGLLSPLDDPAPLARIGFGEGGPWLSGAMGGTEPLRRDPRCPRCPLARARRAVCMESVGPPGAPLLVLSSPTERDDAAGGPVETGLLAEVLAEARKHVPEVRLTWAVRCAAGLEPESGPVAACRPYLAWELDQAPRAVLLGPTAAESATGVAWNALRSRRGWALSRGRPCFLVMALGAAQRSRFVRAQFRADLEWALRAPAPEQIRGEVEVLATPARAVEWLGASTGDPLVFDAEHWPKSPWAVVPEKEGGRFRLLALALCQDPGRPVVIPEEVLADPGVVAALRAVMEDPARPKLNQDAKHDVHVLWRALGIDVRGIEWDTLIASRLLDSDAPAGLGKTAWKVGFGGYKELGQLGSEEDDE